MPACLDGNVGFLKAATLFGCGYVTLPFGCMNK